MIRSNTRAPGSTLTTSGSASVRSLARKASYLTSLRSGLAAAPMLMPGAMAGAALLIPFISFDTGTAVLLPRRGEPMPVDQARLLDPVLHAHAKALAHLRPDAEGAIGLANP